jgi:hypothetical protein
VIFVLVEAIEQKQIHLGQQVVLAQTIIALRQLQQVVTLLSEEQHKVSPLLQDTVTVTHKKYIKARDLE